MGRAVAPATMIFSFGLFEADVAHSTLTRGGVRVKIQDQPLRVLILLLEQAGEIVTREELRQKLWPEGTFVDFEGSLNVVIKKLRAAMDDDSDNPRFIETVPRRGYRFIAPVTKKVVASTTAPLEPAAPIHAVGPLPIPQKYQRRYVLYTALGLLAVCVAASTWFLLRSRELRSKAQSVAGISHTQVPVRESVAVLGFQNVSGRSQDEWLGTAFTEMLNTELAGGETLRLVAGEDVANLKATSPWSVTDSLDRATAARIGVALNANLLVLGSYTAVGSAETGELRFDVRLQDAKSGEILTQFAETCDKQQLFQTVSQVGSKLRQRLGIPLLGGTEQAGVLAAMPLDPDAARFYSLGVAKLHEFDALAAKDLLQQAVNADPKFSLAHAMLARAWAQLGYEQNRKQEARTALSLDADLLRSDRLLIEGDYDESVADHEHAASVYHALFELFPDNVDYGLQLAAAQSSGGHPSQARETLRQLRNLPAPFSDEPRIDLAEAKLIEDKPEALVLIRRALAKSSAQSKRLVYAQARRDECLALVYGDHPEQAPASCEDAYNIFMAAGNWLGAADAVRLLGDRQGSEGHLEEAIATYQRALEILRGTGEHEKTGAIFNNMAIDFENEGKLEEAEKFYRQAQSHFEQAGNKANEVTAIVNIADVLYERGELAAAKQSYLSGLKLIASVEPSHPRYALYRLADLELAQGEVEQARRDAQNAVNAGSPAEGGYQYLGGAMIVVGDVMEAQGNLAAARQQFEQALSLDQKTGQTGFIPEVQQELAELEMEDGHPQKAEAMLHDMIPLLEKEKELPSASAAYVLLSRALLAQGKFNEAEAAAKHGSELSLTNNDPALKLPAALQMARVEEAYGDGERNSAARQKLLSTIASAKKLGYYQIECEARIALGEWQTKSNPSVGHAQLTGIAKEARERGLGLLAQNAEHAIAATTDSIAVSKPSR